MYLLDSKTLTNLEGQIQITVCKTSQYNWTRSKTLGYSRSSDFWRGYRNESSTLTWTGPDETLTYNQAFQFLFSGSGNVSMLMDILMQDNKDLKEKDLKLINKFSLPFGNCKMYEGKVRRSFTFLIEENKKAEFIIFFSDSSAALSFQVRSIFIIIYKAFEFKTGPNVYLLIGQLFDQSMGRNIQMHSK